MCLNALYERNCGQLTKLISMIVFTRISGRSFSFSFRTQTHSIDIKNISILPPTTRHDRMISSPSCLGPILLLFSCRPHLSSTTGCSGKTKYVEEGNKCLFCHSNKRKIKFDLIERMFSYHVFVGNNKFSNLPVPHALLIFHDRFYGN